MYDSNSGRWYLIAVNKGQFVKVATSYELDEIQEIKERMNL